MSGIYGLLGLEDGDTSYVDQIGQRLVFEAITKYVTMLNEELAAAQTIFIARETEEFKFRYKLPVVGHWIVWPSALVRRDGLGAYGGWDVALPLEGFGKQIAAGIVSISPP